MHSFQRVLRSFLLDLGNVDLDLVVVHVLVGTEHQIQEGSDDDHGHDGEEVEADFTLFMKVLLKLVYGIKVNLAIQEQQLITLYQVRQRKQLRLERDLLRDLTE